MFQNVIEDVTRDDFKSNSRIVNWFGEKSENMPEWVKVGGRWLFVTEKSALFQLIHKATAYSDFIARYAQHEFLKDKKAKMFKNKNGREMNRAEMEAMETQLLTETRDAYINYSRPDNKVLQYINDIGLAMFTKYAIRVQKVITSGILKHPTRFATALAGLHIADSTIDWGVPTVMDKYMFLIGPTNIFYTPGVFDIAEGLLVPQMIENVGLWK